MKAVRYIVQVLLLAAIVVLVYFIYTGVMKPINFDKAQEARYEKVIQKLKDIRTAQVAYKAVYGKYTGSFDTLIHFIKDIKVKWDFYKGLPPPICTYWHR